MIEMILTAEEEQSMDPDLIFEEEVLVKPQYTESGSIPEKLTPTLQLPQPLFPAVIPVWML